MQISMLGQKKTELKNGVSNGKKTSMRRQSPAHSEYRAGSAITRGTSYRGNADTMLTVYALLIVYLNTYKLFSNYSGRDLAW